MDGLLIIILVSFLLIGGLFLISNLFDFPGKRKTDVQRPTRADAQSDNLDDTRWRSVKIAPGAARCEYASILSGKVFLLSEAPPLPLVNCNQTDCSCRYIHLDDRRSGIDRRDGPDTPGPQPSSAQTDQRRRGGRRAADLVA